MRSLFATCTFALCVACLGPGEFGIPGTGNGGQEGPGHPSTEGPGSPDAGYASYDAGSSTGDDYEPHYPDASCSSDSGSAYDSGTTDDPVGQDPHGAGQMTASEWDDLANWQFWLDLQDNPSTHGLTWAEHLTRWGVTGFTRIPVVVSSDSLPVADAVVQLFDGDGVVAWEARTDRTGVTHLFADLTQAASPPFTVFAAPEGCSETTEVVADWREPVVIDLSCASPSSAVLDVAFVVDTTGSMGDELYYLQAELENVIVRSKAALDQEHRVRVSVNFYRDDGDEYVVRSFPFSEDIDQVLGQLGAQRYDGGGDWPEAMDQALLDAIRGHQWSGRATDRLLFLVCDAPPHSQYNVIDALHGLVAEAAAKGIRIIPVAGTGIDKETELLLRSFAIATGGTYVFITDHSGIGGDHLDPDDETVPDPQTGPQPTIPEVHVEALNDLLVRLIVEAVQSPGDGTAPFVSPLR